jgi:hypothetical protein
MNLALDSLRTKAVPRLILPGEQSEILIPSGLMYSCCSLALNDEGKVKSSSPLDSCGLSSRETEGPSLYRTNWAVHPSMSDVQKK